MTPDKIIPLEDGKQKHILEKVIEERCDEYDYYLEQDGFEILDREMIRVATSIYNYEVTVKKY